MTRVAQELSRFTKKEIDLLFKKSERVVSHPALNILRAPATHDFGRILLIASRKVGNAPTRNKLKRQLRAIFFEERLYERGYDCIVILRKEAATLSFAQIKQLLIQALENKKSA